VLHDFLAGILRQGALERVNEARGRLRSYLVTSLARHLGRWRHKEGLREPAVLDSEAALDFDAIARRYEREKFNAGDTPDRIFERKWAMELLGHAMEKLAAGFAARGKIAIFNALRPALEAGGTLRGGDTAALAASLGMSETAVRTAMSRLLNEFRKIVKAEVSLTVEKSDDVADELKYLLGLFAN
jgi:RNA polymerase sigma-70 factor (ECF subfamily)